MIILLFVIPNIRRSTLVILVEAIPFIGAAVIFSILLSIDGRFHITTSSEQREMGHLLYNPDTWSCIWMVLAIRFFCHLSEYHQ